MRGNEKSDELLVYHMGKRPNADQMPVGRRHRVWTTFGAAMWNKKERGGFDAAVWKGQIDVTTATVRVAMLFGLGLLWVGLVGWVFLSG